MPRVPGVARRRAPERRRRYAHDRIAWQYERRNGLIPAIEPFVDAVGTSGAVQTLAPNATIPYPTGIKVGQYVIVTLGSADGTITTTAASVGFTELLAGSTTGASDVRYWGRQIDGSEGANISVTSTGTKGRAWMAGPFNTYGEKVVAIPIADVEYDTTSDTTATIDLASQTYQNGDRVLVTLYDSGDFTTSAWSGYSLTDPGAVVTFDPDGLFTHTAGRTGTSTFQHVQVSRRILWGGTATLRLTITGGAPNTNTVGACLAVVLRAVYPTTTTVVTANPAAETDAAQPLGRSKARPAGVTAETDTPLAVGRAKIRALGTALETDAGQPLGKAKRATLGVTAETDAAQPTPRKTGLTAALGTALETDAPIAVARIKKRLVGVTAETDAPIAVGRVKRRTAGITAETDTPLAFGKRKTRLDGVTAETDTAVAFARSHLRLVGVTAETDTCLAFGRAKRLALGIALETDSPVSITAPLTDLSIQYVTTSTPVTLAPNGTPSYPAGAVAGDLIFLYAASGDGSITSGAAILSAGFSLVASASGGGVNDARLYVKPSAGGESGTVSVTTSGTKGRSWMTLYHPPGSRTAAVQASAVAYDTTSDTSVSTVTASMTTAANDRLITFTMAAGDFSAGAWTGNNLTQSGATLGSYGSRTTGRTGTNTLEHFQGDKKVTTGGTGAVTSTGTGNIAAGTAASIVVNVRTSPGTLTASLGTATETDSVPTLGRRKSRTLGVPFYSSGYGEGPYGGGPYGGGDTFSDTAMPFGVKTSPVLGTPITNDEGQILGKAKRKTLGTVTEADAGMRLFKGIIRNLGIAVEVDSAPPLGQTFSSVTVRIQRDLLPTSHHAYIDGTRRGASGRLSRMYRMGSLVQRVLLLWQPSPAYPLGRVVVTSDLDLIESWDADAVILDPEGYTTDNHSWEAGVLEANGYIMEAAP